MSDAALQSLGFIGLGLMGTPIARALRAAGYPLHVWGRRREALEPLVAMGATACESPADVARQSEVGSMPACFPEQLLWIASGCPASVPQRRSSPLRPSPASIAVTPAT